MRLVFYICLFLLLLLCSCKPEDTISLQYFTAIINGEKFKAVELTAKRYPMYDINYAEIQATNVDISSGNLTELSKLKHFTVILAHDKIAPGYYQINPKEFSNYGIEYYFNYAEDSVDVLFPYEGYLNVEEVDYLLDGDFIGNFELKGISGILNDTIEIKEGKFKVKFSN